MRWIAVVTVAVLCGAGVYLLPKPFLWNAVPTAKSRSKDAFELPRVFAAGIVEGTQSPLVLRFEVPGRVRALRVSEGDTVRENQVLAELESDGYELHVVQAKARADIAQVEMSRLNGGRRFAGKPSQSADRSSRDSDEIDRLIAPTAYESRDDLSIAQSRFTEAEAGLKLENLTLEKTRLKAPFDGTILAITLKSGEVAGPSAESGAITLVNRAKTRVRAFVEELDVLNVTVGQKAQVVIAGASERTYDGVVISCAPYVQPKLHRHLNPGERLDVRVREIIVELKDGKNLLIGLPVEVYLEGNAAAVREQKTAVKADHPNATRLAPPRTASRASVNE